MFSTFISHGVSLVLEDCDSTALLLLDCLREASFSLGTPHAPNPQSLYIRDAFCIETSIRRVSKYPVFHHSPLPKWIYYNFRFASADFGGYIPYDLTN